MVAHSVDLLPKCAQFRHEGKFIDVRLKVGEDVFPAHRIVLAANSDYFHAMFTDRMKESNQEVIELKDESITPDALKIVMDSIYTGDLHVNEENVFEVLAAADHLQVTSVVQQCCDFLLTEFVQLRFDVETYCRVWTIADRHGLKDLQEAAEHNMASMFKDLSESEDFLTHLGRDELFSLLSRDDLAAPSETFVFKSVMQWIKHKKEERMAVAAKVIGAVRLGLVDIGELIEELNTEEMQRDPEIHMLVYESFLHNYMPASSSKFAVEKAKPRSLRQVLVAILPQSEMQYFDVDTKNWRPLPTIAPLTEATACFCAEYAGNFLYVAAKKGNDFVSYRYNTVSNAWETLPPFFVHAVSDSKIDCLCFVDNCLYAICGGSAYYRYTPAKNNWQRGRDQLSFLKFGDLSTQLSDVAAVVWKSCIYVLYSLKTSENRNIESKSSSFSLSAPADKTQKTNEKRNTESNLFGLALGASPSSPFCASLSAPSPFGTSATASSPFGTAETKKSESNSSGFAFGARAPSPFGLSASSPFGTAEKKNSESNSSGFIFGKPKPTIVYCFDPAKNEWLQKASTCHPHFGSSLFVVDDRLHVAGGNTSSQVGVFGTGPAPVEVYDEQNNTWSVVEQKHIPPNNLGAVEIEGRVYFIINKFPVNVGITIPPGEVYDICLNEWEKLAQISKDAVLCYLPVKTEGLKADVS